MTMRLRRSRLTLALWLFVVSGAWGAGNEPVHPVPNATSSTFNTRNQTFLQQELPAVLSRYLPTPRGLVLSGGLHAPAASCTSALFSLEAFTTAGNRITADGAGGTASINYAAPAIAANCTTPGTDVCWVVGSSAAVPTLPGSAYQRAGTSNLYVDCTSATEPPLPADSVALMKVSITDGALSAVTDLSPPRSVVGARLGGVFAADYGAVFVAGGAAAVTADDCGLAIQAAHDALPAEGGTIYLGLGACLLKTTVVLTKRVTLVGYGPSIVSSHTAPTMIVKASTLNGPAFQIGNHAGLNYLAASTQFRDFTLYGQAGNGGDGIQILDHGVTLERVSVFLMGRDGIRVGTDSTPRCDCNNWRLVDITAMENTRDGIRIQHWEDGAAPDANGGTGLQLAVKFNGGVGLHLRNTWVNLLSNVIATANGSYGLVLGNGAAYNRVLGADLAEGNCTGGCDAAPGDVLFDGGPTNPPVANTLFATTLVDTRVIDLTPKPFSNTYMTMPANSTGTRLQGLLSLAFTNPTEVGGLPAKTHFSVRSASGPAAFGEIAAGQRALATFTMPAFTGIKGCLCDPGTDFSHGLVWQTYAVDGACTVTMQNYSGSPITPPEVTWQCLGVLFPLTVP